MHIILSIYKKDVKVQICKKKMHKKSNDAILLAEKTLSPHKKKNYRVKAWKEVQGFTQELKN